MTVARCGACVVAELDVEPVLWLRWTWSLSCG